MVNIDTVYQKVLMFANKEQRGYITPQEFNMFADQAQKEIFEQYFYDIDFHNRRSGNSTEYSDAIHNLNEKITIFESTGVLVGSNIGATDLYRLGTVRTRSNQEVEQVQQNEFLYINNSPLTKPTSDRPIYVRTGNAIRVYPAGTVVDYTYIRKPVKPNWSYVVVNGKAMYDTSQVVHFELHESEENELVYKILKFAGVSMKRNDLAQSSQGLESLQVQQEKQ
tara:strand:- start:1312 stop:1980 length:669 start_codon:yes stop_codon:yes gene_type:complete